MAVFVCSSIFRSLSIPKYERFAPNYFAWDPKKGLINNFWYMFIIYWTTRTLIGDNGTLRHSSLEFKVNFCQDKIFAKEILWKVKRSKISTNSPYISNVLRLLKLLDIRRAHGQSTRTKFNFQTSNPTSAQVYQDYRPWQLTLQINHCRHICHKIMAYFHSDKIYNVICITSVLSPKVTSGQILW